MGFFVSSFASEALTIGVFYLYDTLLFFGLLVLVQFLHLHDMQSLLLLAHAYFSYVLSTCAAECASVEGLARGSHNNSSISSRNRMTTVMWSN